MAESIVQDWIAEYESLEEQNEIQSFSNMHEHNQEIAQSVYTIFNERLKYPKLIHEICNQFHSFYRSEDDQLKRFTLQFIPVLIYIYLNSVALGDKKNCRSIETLLITIYNVEVSTDDCNQKIVSFRMPVLAQASIYHEEKSLHPTDLRRWEENSNRDVKWGPLPQIESINAQNRMKIMTALLFAYNQQLSLIPKSALYHLCRTASQIVNQGFSKLGHAHRSSYGQDPNLSIQQKPIPRIPLSSQFLVELVHSIYFAMFNDFGTIAIQTMDDIHHRACYEMYTDLILVTNAVRNSLHANPSGQPSDGPMGLSVALTPATNTVTVSKSMITNASFRTKKLPDDIPIQNEQNSSGAPLMSISEETGSLIEKEQQSSQIGARNSAIRSSKEGGIKAQAHKALIAGFKKARDKDKDKDKEKDKESKNISASKNGSIDDIKITPREPPIPPVRRMLNRALNTSNTDSSSSVLKTKHLDNSIDSGIQLQNLTNGSNNTFNSDDLKTTDSLDNNIFETNSDLIDSKNYDGQNRSSIIQLNDSQHKIEIIQK